MYIRKLILIYIITTLCPRQCFGQRELSLTAFATMPSFVNKIVIDCKLVMGDYSLNLNIVSQLERLNIANNN